MLVPLSSLPPGTIIYPESDGKPMADNTKQARWIVVLYGNLSALFAQRPDVFVAADNLWYPVEGEPGIWAAPDVYLVFGRPKGDRPSYKQWEEDNIPLTVAFEIRSPGNDHHELMAKHLFYEEHGVEEYYEYDPDANRLYAFVRRGGVLARVRNLRSFVSPHMGIRFEITDTDLIVYGPDGERFQTFEEIKAERDHARERAEQAEQHARQAEQQARQAEQHARQAEQHAHQAEEHARQAEQQAQQAQHGADEAEQRYERLIELSRKARQGMASVDELAELERLFSEIPRKGPADLPGS